MAPVRAGQVIDGRYRVDRKLGAGGMGVVFSAIDLLHGGSVAIKFMKDADADRDDVERFRREVEATTRLKGPHVARTLGSGWLDEASPFLVMEYVDGEPLSAVLSRESLSIGDAVACAICVCDALAEAHAAGIVHRDVKPSNIILTRRDPFAVKLVDFGASKLVSREATTFTATDCVVGSPLYSSPEQIATPKEIDARADIWGLGVTLYTLLTRRAPFAGANVAETYKRILNEMPSPVHVLRADAPRELSAIVSKCLRKDRDERFSDVRALASALLPFAPEGLRRPSASTLVIVQTAELAVVRADPTAAHDATLVVPPPPRTMLPNVPMIPSDQVERIAPPPLSGTTTPASFGLVAAGAALIVLTIGGTLAWRYRASTTTAELRPEAAFDPAPSATTAATAATPAATSPAMPLVTSVATAPTHAGSPPPPPPPRPIGAVRKTPRPPEAKTPTSKVDCNANPFVIDSDGIKSFRTECM